ncbi:dorsal-ventral patterning protein Sog [Anopheles ziemanni]|uniref:dorsal-ventral patterning protein Sog n=1 Tax=Anopheles coustani TaxID=139045 RepID=UPI002658E0E6|nr:dorsal-ventral patterning protein Sog [Anopheles coustani]XP_058176089.1 dorsal-ventral patterning protein Sog [Anopheles ziemanni]
MAKFIATICLLWLTILTLVGFAARPAMARRHPLLIEDEGARRNRPAECQFGKTIRELHTTWFADLGPPFGVMYCIMCECVPFQKKRRVVGRVQCRNIKNECPKPSCDDPILLPGRCCKICPGDAQSPDVVKDLPQATMPEEEERSKHFAALLTGRTSATLKRDDAGTMYSTLNPQNIVATGRFSFHKKNLYYSFYVSERAARPRSIQFVHANGNILEEHTLAIATDEGRFSVYQNTTGKVCGVWRRVPREYRRLLRDELMSVVLLWGGRQQAELALAGPIAKYPALAHELFSSLLEPGSSEAGAMAGAGGTAIVSTSSGVTSSIHLTVVLNGLFAPEDIADVPLAVRLESLEKRQLILEDVQRVKKPSHDINILEVSSPVSVADLRLLTRGKLTLTVESRRNPDLLRLQGPVRGRVACEVFQTLLSSHGAEARSDGSGLAWMYQARDGSLVYQVQTHNLPLPPTAITLLDDSAKRKPELETLTRVFAGEQATGALDRMGPRILEPLYSGDLVIQVASDQNLTLLHGKFVTRQVADARDTGAPVLLRRGTPSGEQQPPAMLAHAVGMAWMAVDNECALHYDLSLAGIPAAFHPLQLILEELPLEAPNAPRSRRLLEDFGGNQLEGFALTLAPAELAKLETSVLYLEVRSNATADPILRSRLRNNPRVPNHCTGSGHNDNEVQQQYHPYTPNDHHPAAIAPPGSGKCYHSGRFYDDGETWRSTVEACTMCSCDHHQYRCEKIKCPPLRCRKEDVVHSKGDCCPTCRSPSNNIPTMAPSTSGSSTAARGCNLGEEFHEAGSSWHPYLHPSGYEVCTTCTCELFTLQVKCTRAQCPPLTCSDKVAYRPDRKACCKVCPIVSVKEVTKKAPADGRIQHDETRGPNGTLGSPQAILDAGGCRHEMNIYENGQEYHPILATHGEEKCIKCRCKDGQLNCNRKRCNRAMCSRQNGRRQQQPVDECCQCRPARHHRKRQQQQQQQHQQQQQQQQQTSIKS